MDKESYIITGYNRTAVFCIELRSMRIE
uniref:Uncharacterized protein n=1 Tax=Anguilla anguilla TaxID=7936 RepID=A0A0E9SVF6_ANGAN